MIDLIIIFSYERILIFLQQLKKLKATLPNIIQTSQSTREIQNCIDLKQPNKITHQIQRQAFYQIFLNCTKQEKPEFYKKIEIQTQNYVLYKLYHIILSLNSSKCIDNLFIPSQKNIEIYNQKNFIFIMQVQKPVFIQLNILKKSIELEHIKWEWPSKPKKKYIKYTKEGFVKTISSFKKNIGQSSESRKFQVRWKDELGQSLEELIC